MRDDAQRLKAEGEQMPGDGDGSGAYLEIGRREHRKSHFRGRSRAGRLARAVGVNDEHVPVADGALIVGAGGVARGADGVRDVDGLMHRFTSSLSLSFESP